MWRERLAKYMISAVLAVPDLIHVDCPDQDKAALCPAPAAAFRKLSLPDGSEMRPNVVEYNRYEAVLCAP